MADTQTQLTGLAACGRHTGLFSQRYDAARQDCPHCRERLAVAQTAYSAGMEEAAALLDDEVKHSAYAAELQASIRAAILQRKEGKV